MSSIYTSHFFSDGEYEELTLSEDPIGYNKTQEVNVLFIGGVCGP